MSKGFQAYRDDFKPNIFDKILIFINNIKNKIINKFKTKMKKKKTLTDASYIYHPNAFSYKLPPYTFNIYISFK